MSKIVQLRSMSFQLAYLRKSKCSSLKREIKQENRFGNATSYRKKHNVDKTVIQIDEKLRNNVHEPTNFTQKLRRTNQILLEQAKDPFQLKAKIQKKRITRGNLQQEIF